MSIQWTKDMDQAMVDARRSGCPVFVDFYAAPM